MPAENFEDRLDTLRTEARAGGRVTSGRGVDVAGGPIPAGPTRLGASENSAGKPGYYGMPVVKPPVWTWEIPLYFFVGGLAGMAAVIALAGWLFHERDLARVAVWTTAIGAGIFSPALLIADLGRPKLFLNMLRVFKPQSAMSVGAWILSLLGACAVPAAVAVELHHRHLLPGDWEYWLGIAAALLLALSAGLGTLLATYTGVLIGATSIPVWFTHRTLLPAHFGIAALGSAAAWLVLLGSRLPALRALGIGTAGVETLFWLWLLCRRHGAADRAAHEGTAGVLLQTSEVLTGPVALALWLPGWSLPAAGAFLLGALLSRYGWLAAGRQSGRDPEAAFAAQS